MARSLILWTACGYVSWRATWMAFLVHVIEMGRVVGVLIKVRLNTAVPRYGQECRTLGEFIGNFW